MAPILSSSGKNHPENCVSRPHPNLQSRCKFAANSSQYRQSWTVVHHHHFRVAFDEKFSFQKSLSLYSQYHQITIFLGKAPSPTFGAQNILSLSKRLHLARLSLLTCHWLIVFLDMTSNCSISSDVIRANLWISREDYNFQRDKKA